jgi:hypothetical protein
MPSCLLWQGCQGYLETFTVTEIVPFWQQTGRTVLLIIRVHLVAQSPVSYPKYLWILQVHACNSSKGRFYLPQCVTSMWDICCSRHKMNPSMLSMQLAMKVLYAQLIITRSYIKRNGRYQHNPGITKGI